MRLSFWAKEDQLVPVPGVRPSIDQAPEYVGRAFLPGKPAGFPATEVPFVVDSETTEGRRLVHLTRRDACLLPADEATAAACGMSFVPHQLTDGVMAPIAPPST